MQLYPDDPALGSPFGTGNETFGISSQYKRVAAIMGDATTQAPRREWIQAASGVGVKTFGYYFTDQNAVTVTNRGGMRVPFMCLRRVLILPTPH